MRAPGQSVDINGKRLHVVVDGVGEPPLLLASGLGGAWYDWIPLLAHLPAGHRVVRFDRPGLGESPPHRSVPTLTGEVERLAALIRCFSERGAVVVAHSLAGLHAEALARRHPELVHGLVLVDPSTGPPHRVAPGWLRAYAGNAGWALARFGDRTGLSVRFGPGAVTAALRLAGPGRTPAGVLTEGRAAFRSAVPAAAAWCEQVGYRSMVNDLVALRDSGFPAVPSWVLTAAGDLHGSGALRWIRRHQRLAAELGGRYRLLTHEGHFLAWEAPEAVAEAIRDVLAGFP